MMLGTEFQAEDDSLRVAPFNLPENLLERP